ncbi:histone lysine methyltransferase Set9 [Marasmius tenuissimus]|uniref:Histone lysine methyltransferase Set9 n=1 Tax=Marasmius tenuissimus TaxID=585030 RepID=A0ABR2ZAV7_9AGAR
MSGALRRSERVINRLDQQRESGSSSAEELPTNNNSGTSSFLATLPDALPRPLPSGTRPANCRFQAMTWTHWECLTRNAARLRPKSSAITIIDDILTHAVLTTKRPRARDRHAPLHFTKSELDLPEAVWERILCLYRERMLDGDTELDVSELASRAHAASHAIAHDDQVAPYFDSRHQMSPEQVQPLVEWWLACYPMVTIVRSRKVRLRQRKGDNENRRGFSIDAVEPIANGELIYELVGAVSAETYTDAEMDDPTFPYHDFSTAVAPHENPRAVVPQSCLLVGPVRFVNHDCVSRNAEFKEVPGAAGYVLRATADIPADAPILVNYGKNYFGIGLCPCSSCKTLQPSSPPPPRLHPKPATRTRPSSRAYNANRNTRRRSRQNQGRSELAAARRLRTSCHPHP